MRSQWRVGLNATDFPATMAVQVRLNPQGVSLPCVAGLQHSVACGAGKVSGGRSMAESGDNEDYIRNTAHFDSTPKGRVV